MPSPSPSPSEVTNEDRVLLARRFPNKQLPLGAAVPIRSSSSRQTKQSSASLFRLQSGIKAVLPGLQSGIKEVLPGLQSETGPLSNSVSVFQLVPGTQQPYIYIWPGGHHGAHQYPEETNSRQRMRLQLRNSGQPILLGPRLIYGVAMGKGKKVDSLSALPDDVLVNILDRLTIREAARTKILSKRWTQLCAKLSRLIISAQHFLLEGVSCTDISDDELVHINEAVVQAIESILARRNPGEHTIRLLSTMFYLRDDVPISIGQAIGHAMAAHLVENVKFNVMTGKYDIIDMVEDDLVTSARNFMLFFVACPSAFGGLTALDLENLRFGESDISNILITCKRLKHLRLYNCDSGDCSTLPVEHTHLSELRASPAVGPPRGPK